VRRDRLLNDIQHTESEGVGRPNIGLGSPMYKIPQISCLKLYTNTLLKNVNFCCKYRPAVTHNWCNINSACRVNYPRSVNPAVKTKMHFSPCIYSRIDVTGTVGPLPGHCW